MTKADSVHSTPPTNASVTRRKILGTAVGAAAALAATGASPMAAAPGPDPIYAAIDAHKVAYAAFDAAVRVNFKLDAILPKERRRSTIKVWETRIVETDDPRWIASERAVSETSHGETTAAVALCNVKPTTLAGAATLLQYVAQHSARGDEWPDALEDDEGNVTCFYRDICLNAAELLGQVRS